MFTCDHKKLRLSFNKFHNFEKNYLPEHGEFCLLELKDGRYTGGEWWPGDNNGKGKKISGKFIRGTADTVQPEEVAKWHTLDKDDLTNCLENSEINWINIGPEGEGVCSVVFKDFKSTRDGKYPKDDQYCLLILADGGLGAGRWEKYNTKYVKAKGTFIYAPALAQHSIDRVWAWTPLSPDDTFERKQEEEKELRLERKLNRDPSADPEKFKYGTDIKVYYEKALEKLRKDYPWATVTQMKKSGEWIITPVHGQYVFGQDHGMIMNYRQINEWKDGSTADEFIDFLCKYTEESVRNSNPDKKFSMGMDIGVYLDQAFGNVKKDYRWADRAALDKACRYVIKKVKGDWEFVRDYGGKNGEYVCNCPTAEEFIRHVENDYQNAALRANPVVDVYQPEFGHVDLHGWYLERYQFSKLESGDYKVDVQAGDRVTGGGREFFITPHCFEAKTYDEFLDRYLEIVPGGSFGLCKEQLINDAKLKSFLGY
ncbi:MAG: hypothetical protein IK001_04440 [Lachnospiraceae bacterium]|nr:hypothetical protein [Lachnospiraceae bacterium]